MFGPPTHLGLASPVEAGQRGAVMPRCPATILVLEENAAVQELIDQALRESGHRVLTTNNALEALELLQRLRIDVIVMGELVDERGPTLVEELRTLQPGVRIVTIAGDDLDAVDDCVRLPRPVALDDLREAAAAHLDEARDRT
jgi:CheY-like chemotaxis protein